VEAPNATGRPGRWRRQAEIGILVEEVIMRKRLTIVAACGLVGVFGLTAAGMPPAMGGGMGSMGKPSAPRPEGPAMEAIHKAMIPKLKLTDKQAPVVVKILADFRKDFIAYEKKTGPEVSGLNMQLKMYHRAAKSAKAMAAVKGAVSRLAQIRATKKKKHEGLITQLKGVLDKEQLAAAMSELAPRKAVSPVSSKFHLLNGLKLTDEQKAKLTKLMEKHRADKAKKGANPRALINTLWGRIINEVLTAKNRIQLQSMMQEASFRRMSKAMLGNVPLTDEQMVKIDVIWKAAHKKAVAQPDNRFAVYGDAQKTIVEEVLTDLQRAEMKSRSTRGGSKTRHGHRRPPRKTGPGLHGEK